MLLRVHASWAAPRPKCDFRELYVRLKVGVYHDAERFQQTTARPIHVLYAFGELLFPFLKMSTRGLSFALGECAHGAPCAAMRFVMSGLKTRATFSAEFELAAASQRSGLSRDLTWREIRRGIGHRHVPVTRDLAAETGFWISHGACVVQCAD